MHLSATALSKYSCPYAYWLHYHQKIRPIEKNENFVIGDGYHQCQAQLAAGEPMEKVREWVTATYRQEKPDIWARVLSLFDAYHDNPTRGPQPMQGSEEWFPEHRFELDYFGHTVVGVFDLVDVGPDCVNIYEYKSTGYSYSDGPYWQRARRSRQLSIYYWAARQLWPDKVIELFFDVAHKAGLRRKSLTIKDTELFLRTGEYLGFRALDVPPEDQREFTGKKGNQFRETPGMFYARLYQRYTTEPTFDRQYIPRLGTDNDRVEANLSRIIRVMEFMEKSDTWFQNEDMCTAYSGCDFAPLCDNYIDPVSGELPDTLMRLGKK